MTILPSIPSDARALVADGAPDAQNAADAALVSIGPGTRALPPEMRLSLIERIIDWFQGGVRTADIAKHFDRLCSDAPTVDVLERLASVVALHDVMNDTGRAALSVTFEQPEGVGGVGGAVGVNAPLTMRVAIGGTALLEEQIGANDHRAVLWFMSQAAMDPVVHLTPALRIAFEGMERLQQRGDRRQALCAAAQQYCHTQHGFGASANALQSVWNGTGPQVYASAIESLPGFDAVDDAIKDDLLAVAQIVDAVAAEASLRPAETMYQMPRFCLTLDLEGQGRYEIGERGSRNTVLGERALPTDPDARACVLSAVVMLAAQGVERLAAAENARVDRAEYFALLSSELTDDLPVRPDHLRWEDVIADASLSSTTYQPPSAEDALETFATPEGNPRFVARFTEGKVEFSDRIGSQELRGAHLRALLEGQQFTSLGDLFLRVRGSEFDGWTHLAATDAKAEWAAVCNACDAETQARILMHLDDVPMLDTTVKRVLMPDYALALPPLGESVLSARAEQVAALQRAAGEDAAADMPGTASASLLMQFPRG